MAKINVNFSEITGKIKPMHAVGQPPFLGTNFSHVTYLKEANIPYSRLHDVGGPYGGFRFVDIPNIFRDFDADENDPESYDFAFTDLLIAALMENNCEPIFRLGVTIENAFKVKAYRIHPPKDFAKWARICEHVIRHYNEGWAGGFHYNIKYWEIWNEPDNGLPNDNPMWSGTPEQYFELYEVTAKHLKKCFGDKIKVGGFASCGFYGIFENPEEAGIAEAMELAKAASNREKLFIKFFHDFLKHVKETDAPLEFFSWHSYGSVEMTGYMADYLDNALTEYGYGDIETQLNEWNNAPLAEKRGTAYASAQAAAMMCFMQNKKTDILCYYDARIGQSVYGGMFNPITHKPFCLYYSFKAFGHLYTLGNQAKCECDEKGLYAVAAANGDSKAVMVVNASENDMDVNINIGNDFSVYLVDEKHSLEKAEANAESFTLKANQVALVKNTL